MIDFYLYLCIMWNDLWLNEYKHDGFLIKFMYLWNNIYSYTCIYDKFLYIFMYYVAVNIYANFFITFLFAPRD